MKKLRVTIVAAVLAVVMVFAAACGNDDNGSGGARTDPQAAQYLALFNQAVGVFEGNSNFEVVTNVTRAQLGAMASEYPAGLVRLAYIEHRTNFEIYIEIILFDTNANADMGAAELLEKYWGFIAGQKGRVVFYGLSRNTINMVIDEIGGEIVTS